VFTGVRFANEDAQRSSNRFVFDEGLYGGAHKCDSFLLSIEVRTPTGCRV
jgi:hypothetical protein